MPHNDRVEHPRVNRYISMLASREKPGMHSAASDYGGQMGDGEALAISREEVASRPPQMSNEIARAWVSYENVRLHQQAYPLSHYVGSLSSGCD